MKKYIDYIKNNLRINDISTMMVYDSFKGHLEESVKTKFFKTCQILTPFDGSDDEITDNEDSGDNIIGDGDDVDGNNKLIVIIITNSNNSN